MEVYMKKMSSRRPSVLASIFMLALALQCNQAHHIDDQHLQSRSFCNTFGGCGVARAIGQNGTFNMGPSSREESPDDIRQLEPTGKTASTEEPELEDAPESGEQKLEYDSKIHRVQDLSDISRLLDEYRTQLDNEKSKRTSLGQTDDYEY